MEQIIRPLQTLANVVAALREDDYLLSCSRRAEEMTRWGIWLWRSIGLRECCRHSVSGALEAMALVERVMRSMQSPVLAFDPEGRLRLLNAAGERAFGLRVPDGDLVTLQRS